MVKPLFRFGLMLLAMIAPPSVFAAVCTSTAAGGNWNAAGTWLAGCGATGPLAGDTVTIATTGASFVTVNVATAAVATVTINAAARLTQTQSLTTSGALTVNGILTSNNAMNIGGATSIGAAGTLTINAAGARTFTGMVTNAGIWNNSGNRAVTFGTDVSNSGTFTGGTALQTFSANPAQLLGTAAMSFGGALTASNGLTVNKASGTVTVSGVFTVGATGLTLTAGAINLANTVAVTGPTSITGILTHTAITGTKTYTGAVTINSGGTMTETVAEPVAFGNNVTVNAGGTLTEFGAATMSVAGTTFTVNGTYTPSTGLHTFSNASPTITGSSAITFGGAVTGTTALTINKAAGALTVNGALTVGSGGLTLTQGTMTVIGATAINAGGGLSMAAATTLSLRNTVGVNGASGISGTLNLTTTAGATRTFTGAVTINSGGSIVEAVASPLVFGNSVIISAGGTLTEFGAATASFAANFTNDGSYTSSTGTHTFTAAAVHQLLGASPITFNGAVTSANGVTVNKPGTFVTAANTFTITGAANTLTVTAGTLNLANTLALAGPTNISGTVSINSVTGTKTFTGAVTINGGGTLQETVAEPIAYGDNVTISAGGTLTEFGAATMSVAGTTFTVDGIYTPSTGLHTFSNANPTITGSSAIAFGGGVTGTTRLTVNKAAGAVTIAGALTVGATGMTLTGGDVTVTGNTTIGAGGLSMAAGTAFSHAGTIGVTGPTSISGTFTTTAGAGTRTFTGAVTITGTGTLTETAAANTVYGNNVTLDAGGTLTEFGAATMSLAGTTFTVNGTYTPSTGLHTFSNANPTITGSSAIAFGGGVRGTTRLTINKAAGVVTIGGALTVGATGLTVTAGAINLANTVAVTGPTSITGTLTHTAVTGTKTYTGAVTINSGGTMTETVAEPVAFGNNVTVAAGGALTEFGAATMSLAGTTFTVNGTYTPSTGLHTFSNANPTITGSSAIAFGGAVTGTTRLTINKAAGAVTIPGTLTVGATGLTLTAGTLNLANTVDVTGPTGITGTLIHTTAAGNRLFRGGVTINGSGTWDNSANALVFFRGGLTNDGTFTSGTAAYTFNTNSQPIAGGNPINFGGAVTITGAIAVTNNNTDTVTISGILNGSAGGSTWVNGANSTLNYVSTGSAAAPMATGVLTASASENTVIYARGGAQTLKLPSGVPPTYYHLTLAGSGIKTMPGSAMTVSGNFETMGTASATALAALTIGGDVTLGSGTSFTTGAFSHLVGGNFTNNGATLTTTGSTVTLNGTAAQAIGGSAASSFNNLTVTNVAAPISANTNFNVAATLNMNGANTLLSPAATVVVNNAAPAGTITGTGTVQVTRTAVTADYSSQYRFTTNTLANLTVEYAGAAGQTVTALTYGGLKINNGSGVALTADTTANGTLTLASGTVTTGAASLISTADCSTGVVSGGGYVIGQLKLTFPANAITTCNYPVGSGSVYAPIGTTAIVSNAGAATLTGSTTGTEHPNINTSSLDAGKDVNRYWTLGTGGDTTASITSYSATFNFAPTDVDGGATPTDFKTNIYSGSAWATPTGTATPTSASITGLTTFGTFAVGEISVSSFNAFETGTAANAIVGNIYTKLAGTAFGLDVVGIKAGAQASSFNGDVTVELLANTGTPGSGYDPDNCPSSSSVIQTVASAAIAGGRSSVGFASVASAYRDLRVRISYPTSSPTIVVCSTDSFSVRPGSFVVTSSNAGNNDDTGAPAIKAGTAFSLTATTGAGYDGTPELNAAPGLVVGSPTAGTLAGSFGAAAAGVATGNAFTYSEVGNFGLNSNAIFDDGFTGVDQSADCTNDFSTTLVGGMYGCMIGSVAVVQTTGSSGFGRFVPDHFAVTSPNLTPACSGMTYMGQAFTFEATIEARNSADALTVNYENDYAVATVSVVAEDQSMANQGNDLGSRIGGLGSPVWSNGSYAIATTSAVFSRPATPLATPLVPNGGGPFDLLVSGVRVSDPDGAIVSSPVMDLRATTSGICTAPGTNAATDCDATQIGSTMKMRFGRLVLNNAYGSNLLDLLIPVRAEYVSAMSGAVPTFQLNPDDSCTVIPDTAVALGNAVGGIVSSVSSGVTLSDGLGKIRLQKPSAGTVGSLDVVVNLGSGVISPNSCLATLTGQVGGAAPSPILTHLLGKWCGSAYDRAPAVKVKFGASKSPFIYFRERY